MKMIEKKIINKTIAGKWKKAVVKCVCLMIH